MLRYVWRACIICTPRDDILTAEAIIKRQARDILKHNYVKAITALLIVLLPFMIIDGTTTVISCAVLDLVADEKTADIIIQAVGYPVTVIAWFFFSPVFNGYIRAYYNAAKTGRFDLNDSFYYFQRGKYAFALKLNIRFVIRMLLPVIIMFAPLIIFEIVSVNLLSEDFYGSVAYNDFYFILAVLSSITTTLYSLRYFTVFTIAAENEYLEPKQIFGYSKYIMKRQTGSAAKLIFSFTPWMLLCLLILPMLYVLPYMTQSLCIGAKWMTKAAFEEN